MNASGTGGKTTYHRVTQHSFDLAQYMAQLLTCRGRAMGYECLVDVALDRSIPARMGQVFGGRSKSFEK